MIRPDQLTEKSALAIQQSLEMAAQNHNSEVTPLHLLLSLLDQADTAVLPLLESTGIHLAKLSEQASTQLANLPTVSTITSDQIRPSRLWQEVLVAAEKEMHELDDSFISTEHLLLALTAVPSSAQELLQHHL